MSGNISRLSLLNEAGLKGVSHYGPSTALKIFQDFILIGYGPILKVFKIKGNSSELIFSEQIFKRNKIHKISVSNCGNKLVACGGRSFRILNFQDLLKSKLSSLEKAINEWIVTAEFLDDNTIIILNSHNTVYKIDISSAFITDKFQLVDQIHCNEKSILYSGSIRILPDGRVIIAAGTVMNGVIIWDFNDRKLIHNLTEHEGSIFGVRIDPSGKYIVSCSDDRSVKLYNFENGKLLANGWGHGSRIWNLEFFKNDPSMIMSTGEDCTIRIWKFHPDNELLEQVELLENVHLGKHVWSGDVDDDNLKLIVSGGADGRIRLHDLENRGTREEFPLSLISEHTSVKLQKNEIIKQFFELPSLDILVILTSQGNIFTLNQSTKRFNHVKLSDEETKKFQNFGIIRGFVDINTVIITTRNADFLILQFNTQSDIPSMKWHTEGLLGNNKVTNLLSFHNSQKNEYYLLVDCPNPNVPFILSIFKFEDSFDHYKTLRLNQPDQTSFTTSCVFYDQENNWLIIGSRYVTIAVYDLNEENETIELLAIFKKLSPGDTITSISSISSELNKIKILITVRDGFYMYANINRTPDFSINILHENKLSRGFIEGGYLDGDLILYGFRSTHFSVWNETKQLEITNELCGGAHRQWDLFTYNDNNKLDYKFVYINKSTLYIKSFKGRFTENKYGLIIGGTHGREIRDVTVSPSLLADGSRLLMTASEDTTVKLSKLLSTGEVENIWSLNHHVSGLQKIKFINGEYVGSSAANEEFYIWKISHLNEEKPNITCFARLEPQNAIPDLRIMDFDAFEYKNGFIVSTVYSDSHVRLFYFDLPSRSFKELANDFYSSCCILNVNFLFFKNEIFLMIGATDGHLSIWNVSSIVSNESNSDRKFGKLIIKQQLHQNGIKAVLAEKNGDEYNILTGGDDNALILSTLSYRDENLYLETKSFYENAASSTITSIAKLKDDRILVTSVDQIARVWTYSDNSLDCITARYTTIADTGCSDSTTLGNNDVVVIGGAGLSVFEVL